VLHLRRKPSHAVGRLSSYWGLTSVQAGPSGLRALPTEGGAASDERVAVPGRPGPRTARSSASAINPDLRQFESGLVLHPERKRFLPFTAGSLAAFRALWSGLVRPWSGVASARKSSSSSGAVIRCE